MVPDSEAHAGRPPVLVLVLALALAYVLAELFVRAEACIGPSIRSSTEIEDRTSVSVAALFADTPSFTILRPGMRRPSRLATLWYSRS